MRNLLFVLIGLFVFIGCSSNKDEEEIINISFDKNEINIPAKGSGVIKISGIMASECEIKSSDEFVAETYSSKDKIEISAKHVGEAFITASYKDKTESCKVKVTPLHDYIGEPVVEFGISLNDLKSKVKGTLFSPEYSVGENMVEIIYQEEGKYIYDTYHFKNDKLIYIYSDVNTTSSLLDILNSLLERFNRISGSSKYYWFEHPNFIVRMNERGGNGGFIVMYAKTAEDMGSRY